MTKHVQQTKAPGKVNATSVADYIVERLAAEGISHCFGVAGDYVFPICDAVDSSAKVKWIGCANELNAAYAADGYARIRGAAMLVTTYGVGELSALNGVMGAKAERSLVFHIVGMPSYQHQRLRKVAHHTLGDGVFGNFVELSARAACCHAVIDPQNCVVEMERIIAQARRSNQPAYVAAPSDYAVSPVLPADVKPLVAQSSEAALQKAMAVIAERIGAAKSVVAFPAFTILRLGLQKEAQTAIEALGCPFTTTLMEKCVIGEQHPQFAGMYAGAVSDPQTREIVEGADLLLDLGGVNLNDITTVGYSDRLDPSRFITVGLNDVRIGDKVIAGVRIADVLAELARLKRPSAPYRRTPQPLAPVTGGSSDRISMAALYPSYAAFLRAGDTVVLETGSTSLGMTPMILPDGVLTATFANWRNPRMRGRMFAKQTLALAPCLPEERSDRFARGASIRDARKSEGDFDVHSSAWPCSSDDCPRLRRSRHSRMGFGAVGRERAYSRRTCAIGAAKIPRSSTDGGRNPHQPLARPRHARRNSQVERPHRSHRGGRFGKISRAPRDNDRERRRRGDRRTGRRHHLVAGNRGPAARRTGPGAQSQAGTGGGCRAHRATQERPGFYQNGL
jgi:indolepyruvate decarboxylase